MADNFQYPEPIQGGDEPVTRQVGVNPEDTQAIEDRKFAQEHPVIQGSPDIFTTRQVGLGQQISSDGTLMADHDVQPGTPILRSDRPIAPTADAGFPGRPGVVPGNPEQATRQPSMDRAAIKAAAEAAGFIVRDAAAPPAGAQPPVVDVIASDDGGSDPRAGSGGPQVISADQLPVIRKAPIVPVLVADHAAPQVRRVQAKKAGKK